MPYWYLGGRRYETRREIRGRMLDHLKALTDLVENNEMPDCEGMNARLYLLVDLAEQLCESYGHARLPDEWLDRINEN